MPSYQRCIKECIKAIAFYIVRMPLYQSLLAFVNTTEYNCVAFDIQRYSFANSVAPKPTLRISGFKLSELAHNFSNSGRYAIGLYRYYTLNLRQIEAYTPFYSFGSILGRLNVKVAKSALI